MNKYLKLFISIIPALVILTGAILFFNYYPRFDIVGDDLIKFGNFEEIVSENSKPLSFLDKWSGWNENTKWKKNVGFNNTNGILLRSGKGDQCRLKFDILDINQYFPHPLLFKVKAKSLNIIRGIKIWDVGRAEISFSDLNKKFIKMIKYNIIFFVGSHPWEEYYMIVTIPDNAKSAHVYIKNYGLSGTLYIDNLSLQPIILKQSFKHLRFVLGILLFMIFITYLWKMRIYQLKYGLLLLTTILFIVIFVLLPEGSITRIIDALYQITGISENQVTYIKRSPIYDLINNDTIDSNLYEVIRSLVPAVKFGTKYTKKEDKLLILKDKIKTIGHFILFTLLTWISCLSFLKESICTNFSKIKRNEMALRYFSILLYLIIFSIFTEVIQFFSPSRFPNINDLGFDLLGISFALISFYIYLNHRIKKRIF